MQQLTILLHIAFSMAISPKFSFLLFLLTLLSSHYIHARESQFFNKIPTNNNDDNNNNNNRVTDETKQQEPKQEVPLNKPEQEPNFIPENENGGYGLYGHEAGQLPPTTTTTTTTKNTNLPNNNQPNEFVPKYLPKNYNTEAYVTEPEGYHPAQETNNNNNNDNYYSTGNAYYKNQKQSYPASTTTTTSTAVNGDSFYQNYDENSYNGQQEGVNEFKLGAKSGYTSSVGNSNYYNAAEKQGMSDTRYLENGKYYYDLNLERNKRYPFENTRGFGDQYAKNDVNYGRNNVNSYDFDKFSNNGFENQGEQFQDFQDEEGLP